MLDGSGRHRLVSRATAGGTFHFGNEAAWAPPFDDIKRPPVRDLSQSISLNGRWPRAHVRGPQGALLRRSDAVKCSAVISRSERNRTLPYVTELGIGIRLVWSEPGELGVTDP